MILRTRWSIMVTLTLSGALGSPMVACADAGSDRARSLAVSAPGITVSHAIANPGGSVVVEAVLQSAGESIAGAQNDVGFDRIHLAIATQRGCRDTPEQACSRDADCGIGEPCVDVPECTVNPDIRKEATSFSLVPLGCSLAQCTAVRALVFSFRNPTRTIPDGSVLYRCTISVAGDAVLGTYALPVTEVRLSNAAGQPVSGGEGRAGSVEVIEDQIATPTATPTRTPSATRSPTVTSTATVTPTPASCPDDCGGNGIVTVDEILSSVGIALGIESLSSCRNADANHDQRVTIDEILAGVNAALVGCHPGR